MPAGFFFRRLTGIKGRSVFLVRHQPNHPDFRLSRLQRLKSARQITEAFEQNRRFAGSYMVMLVREGPGASMRLGVTAGHVIGGAVERNRAKRLLRETFRLNRHRLRGENDIVLLARRRILNAPWDKIQLELLELAGKAGILEGGK